MKVRTIAERNTSEKARRAAQATKVAMADRKTAEEKQSRAAKQPKTAHPGEVPPYCYAAPGMSAEVGAVEAVKALQIAHAADALGLLWQLRRVVTPDQPREGKA